MLLTNSSTTIVPKNLMVDNHLIEEQRRNANSLRKQIREGAFTQSTSGLAPGMVQGNLVILPQSWADEFLQFCVANPTSCPLVGLSKPGSPFLPELGSDIDIRSDIPQYQVYRHGELVDTLSNISALWTDDMVAFVLGCSFSFEEALIQSGLSIRNIENARNVSMFESNIPTQSGGRFHGNLVVTMRPFLAAQAIRAVQVTTRFPKAHGAPVHLGNPELIGISDLSQPDYGDPVTVHSDEIPVFWPCGVTPQVAIRNAKPPLCITHAPGKMLITDRLNAELSIF